MVKVAIHQPEDAAADPTVVIAGRVESQQAVDVPASVDVRPRGRNWTALKLFVLLVLLAVFLPSLITVTGTAGLFLGLIAPRLSAALRFDAVQLHWWSPVAVSNLRMLDLSAGGVIAGAGNLSDTRPVLFEVRRVASREPLWLLALNAGRGMRLDVVNPRGRLIASNSGTNFEETMKAVFDSTSEASGGTRFPFEAVIIGGVIECFLRTEVSDSKVAAVDLQSLAVVEEIEARVSTLNTEASLPMLQLAAVVRGQARKNLTQGAGGGGGPRLAADLDEVIKDFPAVPLEELAGGLSDGDTEAGLVRLTLNPRVDDSGRQLIQIGARNLDLRSLAAFLRLAGVDGELEGQISGGIDARVAGAQMADGVAARVLIEGSNLRYRHSVWEAREWLPLGAVKAAGAVAVAEDGFLLDDLRIESDICRLEGRGEVRQIGGNESKGGGQAEVTAELKLPIVCGALRRTLGLADDVEVESGVLRCTARAESEGRVADAGSVEGLSAKWHLTTSGEQLRVRRGATVLGEGAGLGFEAIGIWISGLPQLRQARLTAGFGVIDCAPDGAAWKVSGRLEPEQLWQQLRQLTDLPRPGLTAPLTFQCRAALNGSGIQLTDVNLNSADLRISSLALGVYPAELFPRNLDGELQFTGAAVAVKTLIAPWHDAWWLADKSGVEGRLNAKRSAGVDALLRIRPEPRAAAAVRLRTISQPSSRLAEWSGNLLAENALIVEEGDLQVSLEVGADGRQYAIRSGQLTLPGLHARLSGGLRLEEGWVNLAVSAETRYDLGILSERMFDPLAGLMFVGSGTEVFTLSGDPAAIGVAPASGSGSEPRFSVEGAVSWEAARFRGLVAGPGAMSLELRDDVVRSGPVQCTLNGGDANVLWQYDLTNSVLALGAGSRVENLKLTEEFCRAWLGYVSPLLAGAVDVQGLLSGRIEECLWSVYSPERSVIRGQFTIHEAAATPGSSLTVLLEVLDTLRRRSGDSAAWSGRALTLPAQTVPVQLVDGWVQHENLVLDLAGYRVTSSGAVGLNQQLALTLSVPLEKQAAGGRAVPIALRGTISAPQPDLAGFLQKAGGQQLQKQLQNQVDRAVNDQLQKLFGRE
jgi:hypothetical protein